MTIQNTLALVGGDLATYSVGDGAGAVRAARSGSIACDIETRGLDDKSYELTAVSIGTGDHAFVLDPQADAAAIRDALSTASTIVFHNSVFDVPPLVVNGLMGVSDVEKVYDTLISARLASPHEHSGRALGKACDRYLPGGYAAPKSALEDGFKAVTGRAKGEMFAELDLSSPAFVAYAAFDIVMTHRLYGVVGQAVHEQTTDHPFPSSGDAAALVEREQIVNRIMLARSAKGIEIDFDVVDELKAEMRHEVERCEIVLDRAGIDTELSREKMKQAVVAHLDELGELPRSYKRLKDGSPSADKRYLEQIEHPLVEAIVTRSMSDRFASDYANKLVHLSQNGRIHPQVNVCAARTGRSSYGSPPLQQFPGAVRRMMRFDEPVTSMDWSSIEPVFLFNAAGESELLEHFESGGDLYQPIADLVGVDRSVAKTILLAQIYGQGSGSLAVKLGRDEMAVRELTSKILGNMPKAGKVTAAIRKIGDAMGVTQTLSGRIVPLDPDPRTGNTRFFGYKAVNYWCQGSCYDLLAEVITECHRRGLGDAIYAAVHDELVVATEAADEVDQIMRTPPAAFCEMAGRTPKLRTGRADLGHHWLTKD